MVNLRIKLLESLVLDLHHTTQSPFTDLILSMPKELKLLFMVLLKASLIKESRMVMMIQLKLLCKLTVSTLHMDLLILLILWLTTLQTFSAKKVLSTGSTSQPTTHYILLVI